ncbi:MAG TPA: DUF5009 domain-containing protein [Chryseolinea sp.]
MVEQIHKTPPLTSLQSSQRLLSLDFMRGFIMVLLALEASRLFETLFEASEGSFMEGVWLQFFHHPWHGLRFWDLIQPGFMYMAGVALALSLVKQEAAGMAWEQSLKKMLKRSAGLLAFGVLNYAVHSDGLHLRLTNVLTQLSFTLLVAFLIFRWSAVAQIAVCVGLLLLRDALYHFTNIPGFDQPDINQHNFGNYVELVYSGRIIEEGWVSINCIPTAVHTIAGALTGKLLVSGKEKIKTMLIWAMICLIVGVGLDVAGISPVIKHIATSSFTIVSLGICLAAYAGCYWWIDVLQHRKYLQFFAVIGMNSIFIYLFFAIVGSGWFNDYIFALVGGLLTLLHTPVIFGAIMSSLCIFALEWGLCYFLYKKKIFFRI